MSKICETCDTRLRLGLCKGKDEDFKYCFRKVGSVNGLEETITPFNTLDELYTKCKWLDWVEKDTLVLDEMDYGDEHMRLLFGQEKGVNKTFPVGYVTK